MPLPPIDKRDGKQEDRGGLLGLRSAAIFLIAVSLGVTALVGWQYLRSYRNTSAVFLKQVAEKAEIRLIRFFEAVTNTARLVEKWDAGGMLNLSDPIALDAKFIPIVEQNPQVHSLLIARRDRLDYALIRNLHFWQVRHIVKDAAGSPAAHWQRIDHQGRVIEEWTAADDFKPTSKTWFMGAMARKRNGLFWTEPYALYPSGDVGITAAVHWKNARGDAVAALNVLLGDVLQIIDDIRIGESFRCFLYSGESTVIDFGRPVDAYAANDKSAKEIGANTPDDPLIAAALTQARQLNSIGQPFPFRYNRKLWWGQLKPLGESLSENAANRGQHAAGDRQRPTGIGILVRQSELLAHANLFSMVTALGLLVSLWALFIVYARRQIRIPNAAAGHRPLDQVSEAQITDWIRQGEGERQEFKSTLRWNLKTDKAGKEIELAVMKTVAAYMNTDGGRLLVGVGDDGRILGIAADGFDSDDKYLRHFGSLFNQHIGVEFSEYVEFGIKAVEGRKMFAVVCRKSPKPVFVRHNKEEAFYIRSGPSSRQLSTSQVLPYLKDRTTRP
jgi:hypothetical protein